MKRVLLAPGSRAWIRPGDDGAAHCLWDEGAGPAVPPLDWATVNAPEPVGVVADLADPPADGAEAVGLRALFDLVPAAEWAVAAEAGAVADWRLGARFCGACAEPLRRDPAERCMVCPRCARRVYPRINPAVITCVTRKCGEEILLARRATPPNGFHSLIAGFVEAGEGLEHAAAREIREEVAVEVRAIRYFGSQTWPFPSNLMVGFFAEHAAGEPVPDGVEIAEAGWYRRDALPTLPGPVSIARRMVDAWAARRFP